MKHCVKVTNGNGTESCAFYIDGTLRKSHDGRSDQLAVTRKEMNRLCMMMLYWQLGNRNGERTYGCSYFENDEADDNHTRYIDIVCDAWRFATPGELVERVTQVAGRCIVFSDVA